MAKTTALEVFSGLKLDEDPSSSEFWAELDAVLSLGGTFNNEEKTIFTAPYVYTVFRKFDPFQHQAVIAKGSRYMKTGSRAKVLGKLDYSIVKVQEEVVQKARKAGLRSKTPQVRKASSRPGMLEAQLITGPAFRKQKAAGS